MTVLTVDASSGHVVARSRRSMQEVARIREYVEVHSRADLLDQVLDEEIPRYAEALQRIGE